MRRRWKLFIAIAVVMLVLAGVWVVTMCIEPSDDVEAYKKSLIAKGEKLTVAELLPPPIPPAQNGADIIDAASHLLVDPDGDWSNFPAAMQFIAPGKAIVAFEQPDVRTDSFTNSWSNVLEAAEANRPATDVFKQMLSFSSLDFHIEYNEGNMWSWAPDQLGPFEDCSRRLLATAVCDLRKDDSASATTNICVLLAFANGEHGERMPSVQYDRIELAEQAAKGSWELLQADRLNDAELALLQTNWTQLEFIGAVEKAFLMERAAAESCISQSRTSTNYFSEMKMRWGWNVFDFSRGLKENLDNFCDSSESMYGLALWQASWSYSDELKMLQDDQLLLETMRTIKTNGFFNPDYSRMKGQLDASQWAMHKSSFSAEYRWMFSSRVPGWADFLDCIMPAEACRRIVITAIALKRYQLKYGAYPTHLDSLVPEFVLSVPMDPVDGKELRYHRNGDNAYLLYSIGMDSKDDGGNPSMKRTHADYFDWLEFDDPDWVWPQPATDAEIQYYYAHLPPKPIY